MRSRRLLRGFAAVAALTVITSLAGVTTASPHARADLVPGPGPVGRDEPDAIVELRGSDGSLRLLESISGAISPPQGITVDTKPLTAALAHLARFASSFGISTDQLELNRIVDLGSGRVIRFDRTFEGVQVFGGQLVVSLDERNNLEFIVGETGGRPARSFPALDLLGESAMARVARQVVANRERLPSTAGLRVESQGRRWYDPAVLGVPDSVSKAGPGGPGIQPVYAYVVRSDDVDVQYQVLVNAATRKPELVYSLPRQALNRVVCDAKSAVVEQYTCDGQKVAHARTEGEGPTGVRDVDHVYDYMRDTARVFARHADLDLTALTGIDHGDDEGRALRATVRVCTSTGCPHPTAFWDGHQLVVGTGLATDDIVAHELAHAVTEHTSELAYLFQTGAISEGLADFWGEIVDIRNGSPDDTAKNRWKVGEGSSIGVVRDMRKPQAYGQPDRMTSPHFFDGSTFADNGGVHYNSGVFAKAASLLVDGGRFNGYRIRRLGPARVAAIMWTLQNLLPPGADYKDVFYTLPLSCRKNVGRAGISEAHCRQVDKAVRATEMHKEPVNGAPKRVGYCAKGQAAHRTYTQGFESTNADWTFDGNWMLSSEVGYYRYAAAGEDAAVAWTVAGDDVSLTQEHDVVIPPGGFMRFEHAYLLEKGDGAIVEYSLDGGATWRPAATLPNVHGEETPVETLGGARSFAGTSIGYGSPRYDLASLAGESVRFRFRSAVVTSDSAWWVDNFAIYTCRSAARDRVAR